MPVRPHDPQKDDNGRAFLLAKIVVWLLLSFLTSFLKWWGESGLAQGATVREFFYRLPLRLILWGLVLLVFFRDKKKD